MDSHWSVSMGFHSSEASLRKVRSSVKVDSVGISCLSESHTTSNWPGVLVGVSVNL